MDLVQDYTENKYVGWIKLYRSLANKGWYKKSYYTHLWIHIMIKATHNGIERFWDGKNIILKPGQFITGRKKLSDETGISQSSIERILRTFENEQQIGQQKSSTSRLISILNWGSYQNNGQQDGQRMDSGWTADGQRMDTIQEYKKGKNEENVIIKELFDKFRIAYPGTKRGLDVEFENFKKKEKDYKRVCGMLLDALNKQKESRERLAAAGKFVPEWKHLKTWINNKCWTEEQGEVKTIKKLTADDFIS